MDLVIRSTLAAGDVAAGVDDPDREAPDGSAGVSRTVPDSPVAAGPAAAAGSSAVSATPLRRASRNRPAMRTIARVALT